MSARGLSLNGDRLFRWITAAFAAVVPVLLGIMLYELWTYAEPVFDRFGLGFLVNDVWAPIRDEYGALTFIYGTVLSSLIAFLVAVPFGVAAAVFLVELGARWLVRPIGFAIELLAAIPSVVYGLWGIFVFIPWMNRHLVPALKSSLGFLPLFQGPSYGPGLLATGLVLSIMIVPTVTSISRDVLATVPREQKEAAYALGATRWETIWHVVLPYARPGVVGAAILALGRALGETMAAAMLIGNTPQIKASLFAPAATLTSVIANEFAEATSDLYVGALIALALVLFLITVLLNILARLLVLRVSHQGRVRL